MTDYLITASLLNSWLYYIGYDSDDQESQARQRESFIQTLKKEFVSNKTIEFGQQFEADVNAICDCRKIHHENNEYLKYACEVAAIVIDGTWQMSCKKKYKNFLLYGRLDVVRGNTIFDIKTTSRYETGKFKNSAQHKLYLYCTELDALKYIVVEIYHGVKETTFKSLCIEEYRDNNIKPVVDNFIAWLECDQECSQLYYNNWKTKY